MGLMSIINDLCELAQDFRARMTTSRIPETTFRNEAYATDARSQGGG